MEAFSVRGINAMKFKWVDWKKWSVCRIKIHGGGRGSAFSSATSEIIAFNQLVLNFISGRTRMCRWERVASPISAHSLGGIKGKSASSLIDNYINDQVISCCSLSFLAGSWPLERKESEWWRRTHTHTVARTIINRRGWVRAPAEYEQERERAGPLSIRP